MAAVNLELRSFSIILVSLFVFIYYYIITNVSNRNNLTKVTGFICTIKYKAVYLVKSDQTELLTGYCLVFNLYLFTYAFRFTNLLGKDSTQAFDEGLQVLGCNGGINFEYRHDNKVNKEKSKSKENKKKRCCINDANCLNVFSASSAVGIFFLYSLPSNQHYAVISSPQ